MTGIPMEIVDLKRDEESLYICCLEDWSKEMKEAGPKKRQWYEKHKSKGLRVKLAKEGGRTGGMIQYLPTEESFLEGGPGGYFILCIWVHGYKEGRGNFQGRGMGKALLKAAEQDVKELGGKYIAAWGISLPFWMRAKWFKKNGYKKIDKYKGAVLMWKSFSKDAEPPRWIREKMVPENIPGKVTVSAFVNGWCPAQNLVYERAKRASKKFGDKVVFQEVDTSDKEVLKQTGLVNVFFVDGMPIKTGPPPSYEKIKKIIEKRVKKLK